MVWFYTHHTLFAYYRVDSTIPSFSVSPATILIHASQYPNLTAGSATAVFFDVHQPGELLTDQSP